MILDYTSYAAILDAMVRTGVYVVEEGSHKLLYLNKRAREVSPEAEVGSPCPEDLTELCSRCLPPAAEALQDGARTGYSARWGGVVDVSVARIPWEARDAAVMVSVEPRMDAVGYAYRTILRVDLEEDRCGVLKSGPEEWLPEAGALSRMLEQFARSGAVHPEDADRFTAFTRLERMRFTAGTETAPALLYRRRIADAYRWSLMEVIPSQEKGGRFALLCVKDVDGVLREGLERGGLTTLGQELIRSLGDSNFSIYTIDLKTGAANPIRVDGVMQEEPEARPWSELAHCHIAPRLHGGYLEEFEAQFSLEGLRRAKEEKQPKTELLCRWHSEDDYRYVSVTAYFGDALESRNYTVVALQDVDERMRRELAHTKRDMQMAAILKSRYQMMNTVYLESGVCERMSLSRSAGPEKLLTGDYAVYIQNALDHFVHPDDVEKFRALMSLEHLRQKAETIEDYGDEIFQYRIRGEELRWIELHILYSRQEGRVMVNILGQDVTKEKQQEDLRLRTLEERAYMITSLSSLFFATYYVDLERDTFRAVTQQHRVMDVLGDEVNFTTALQLYASHFIHPDDREKYLQTMSSAHLSETLRWWQPYVAVEYRKLPDFPELGDECQLVRATAIMAQTGADDMPKTVVYVARDITEKAPQAV